MTYGVMIEFMGYQNRTKIAQEPPLIWPDEMELEVHQMTEEAVNDAYVLAV